MRRGGFAVEESIDQFKQILGEAPVPALFELTPAAIAKPKLRLQPPVKDGHIEKAAGVWSDWHVSETVRPEDANGVNAYSSVICSNRVWDVVQTEKQIITLHQALYKIDEFWLMVLGDMINGSIHPELALTNDLLDPAAAILAATLMQMGIEELKTLGIPINIDCIVGNHPRLSLKMPTKRQAHQSFDWVVYEMVANYFRKDDQVKVNVHTGQMGIREVFGWRYIFEHGIDVKNGREEEFEDRLRALYDDGIYRRATKMRGTSFDMAVIGNMHKGKWLERVMVNGCLTGQNELGMSWRLKPIKAQQFLWGITEKHVRTWKYAVDVTRNVSTKADNPFSEFTKWFMKKHGR